MWTGLRAVVAHLNLVRIAAVAVQERARANRVLIQVEVEIQDEIKRENPRAIMKNEKLEHQFQRARRVTMREKRLHLWGI